MALCKFFGLTDVSASVSDDESVVTCDSAPVSPSEDKSASFESSTGLEPVSADGTTTSQDSGSSNLRFLMRPERELSGLKIPLLISRRTFSKTRRGGMGIKKKILRGSKEKY